MQGRIQSRGFGTAVAVDGTAARKSSLLVSSSSVAGAGTGAGVGVGVGVGIGVGTSAVQGYGVQQRRGLKRINFAGSVEDVYGL